MAVTSIRGKPGVIAGKLPPLVKRFYLQFALAPALMISLFADVVEFWPDRSFGGKVLALVILGFFLTLACRLIAESRAWNNARYLALSAGATALLALLLFLGNTIEFSNDYPTLLMNCAGIALLVMTAPFLRRDHTNEALWEYNRATWSGMASGLAITVLVAAGFLGAIVATTMGTGVPAPLLVIPYGICMSFLAAWQLLAGVPRQFDATPADPTPKWLSRLANIVIVPVTAAGLAALLLYLVGLSATAELPEWRIGWIVAEFAIFVVAAHFVSWPLRDTGSRALRLFHRHYRYALLAPAIVLTLDAAMRIADSGLTEGRYLMLLLAFWLCATAVYHSLPTQRRLVVAPVSLAALLIAASVGPWGATGLSTRLQLSQLEDQLTTHELLVDGKVVPAEAFIETEKMKDISATLDLFHGKDKHKALAAWFADHGLELENGAAAGAVMKSMGLQSISSWQGLPSFDFDGSRQDILDIEGFSYISKFPGESLLDAGMHAKSREKTVDIQINPEDGTLIVIVPGVGDERIVFDVAALAQRLQQERKSWGDDPEGQPITLDGTSESGRLTARLHIHSIGGNLVDGAPEVEYVAATILWRENRTPQ